MFSMFLHTLIIAIRDTAAIWMIAGYMVTLETKIRRIITTLKRVAVERDDWWNREIVYVERVADELDEEPVWVTDDLEEEPVVVN